MFLQLRPSPSSSSVAATSPSLFYHHHHHPGYSKNGFWANSVSVTWKLFKIINLNFRILSNFNKLPRNFAFTLNLEKTS
jgi:hypothetical protein